MWSFFHKGHNPRAPSRSIWKNNASCPRYRDLLHQRVWVEYWSVLIQPSFSNLTLIDVPVARACARIL